MKALSQVFKFMVATAISIVNQSQDATTKSTAQRQLLELQDSFFTCLQQTTITFEGSGGNQSVLNWLKKQI